MARIPHPQSRVLNEVLSLNAQEFLLPQRHRTDPIRLLNEVLSLNAQESTRKHSVTNARPSSMKS